MTVRGTHERLVGAGLFPADGPGGCGLRRGDGNASCLCRAGRRGRTRRRAVLRRRGAPARVGGGFRRAAGRAWRGGRLTGPVPFSAPERLTAGISRSLGETCLPPAANKRRADNGGTRAAGRGRPWRRPGSRTTSPLPRRGG